VSEPESERHAHRLSREAAGGLILPDEAVLAVREHVAACGFDPDARERAGGRSQGVEWRGRVLRGRDMLPPVEAHYIRHVVAGREWPADTSLEEYVASIRETVRNASSGMFTSWYLGQLQVGFVGPTGSMRGPAGSDWILVEYRVATDHIVTAYQPSNLGEVIRSIRRERFLWIRPLS
jgi:hypothetical protein